MGNWFIFYCVIISAVAFMAVMESNQQKETIIECYRGAAMIGLSNGQQAVSLCEK